jgi:hypothetical protein
MLTKYLIIIVAVAGLGIGSAGTLWIAKAVKPTVKVSCPKAPDCDCPELKPWNGIDFDKIKSKYITIQNEQHLTIKGDSLLVKEISEAVKAELMKLKLARCK